MGSIPSNILDPHHKLWVLQYQSGRQIQMRIINYREIEPYFDFNHSAEF